MSADDYSKPAPDGTIYMCGACGRTGKIRGALGDTSCVTWAVLVHEDSIVRNAAGVPIGAKEVKDR